MTLPEVAQGKPGVMTHIEALRNRAAIGHKVVIQGLGYGSELAISLAEEGKDVTLFGSAGEIGGKERASSLRYFYYLPGQGEQRLPL